MDRIEKNAILAASRKRVWEAITDANQFGAWFGAEFEGGFEPDTPARGKIVPTKVDPEIAKAQAPHAGMAFEIHIAKVEPMQLFSFRWRPYAIDPHVDYSNEPMTLVTFVLEAAGENQTSVTVTESGFDGIPAARRAEARAANEQGWEAQMRLLRAFVEKN